VDEEVAVDITEEDLRRKNFRLADIKRLVKIFATLKPVHEPQIKLLETVQQVQISEEFHAEESSPSSSKQAVENSSFPPQYFVINQSHVYTSYNKVSENIKANFHKIDHF
jgi:hypothetical protein